MWRDPYNNAFLVSSSRLHVADAAYSSNGPDLHLIQLLDT